MVRQAKKTKATAQNGEGKGAISTASHHASPPHDGQSPPVISPQSSRPILIAKDPVKPTNAAPTADPRDVIKRDRLLRHRESCRKSYNKKGSTISALKQELDALDAKYNALLTQPQASSLSAESTESPLLAAYVELTRVKRQLVLENEALYNRNAEQMTLEGRLQQVLDVDAPTPLSETPFLFEPLSDAACAQILATARDDVLRFAHSPNKLSLRASVFGWTDYRQVQGNALKFALEKRFATLSAREVVDRTWQVVSSEERCAQLFNPSLQAKLEILQRVNEDTLLMYRTIQSDELEFTAKTVFLLSRLRIAEGYLVLFRSIDPKLISFDDGLVNQVIEGARENVRTTHELAGLVAHPLSQKTARREIWVDKYAWAIVYEDGPESCRFHFGGSTMTNVWLKEVLFVALRWEKMAVGPTILLDM